MKFFLKISLILLTISLCVGCADVSQCDTGRIEAILYEPLYASGFTIYADERGNALISVTKPWQGSALEEQTLAIFSTEEEALGYTDQYIVGHADRVVCMSTSYIAMLDAIERVDAVVGVSGKQYIANEQVAKNPAVMDIGYDSNLNYEALVLLNPDVVLMYGVSAANDTVTAKLRDLGIPYLYLGDYTEESPLGKAEWVVAIAEIMGCREKGEEVFSQIAERYNEIRSCVVRSDDAPKVMFNLPYQDVWYMPSDDSYMVQLIEDAGGQYIYKGKNPTGGSKGISLEEAYMLVSDTDIWLNVGQCKSMEELVASAPNFAECDVVKRGAIYNNNLRLSEAGGSDFWESAIVRPDVVLNDLVSIMSGEPRELYYFRSLGDDVKSAKNEKESTSEGALWGIVLIVILALCVAYAICRYFERGALRYAMLFTLLAVAIVSLAIVDLLIGGRAIPFSDVWVALTGGDTLAEYAVMINKLRLPKVIVAILSGMALSASGLLMQTLFRNPLAGPYVLGINSGASFAVALFTLAVPMMTAEMSWLYNIGVTGVALIGSAVILLVIMALSRKIKSISTILILGMMLGSAISAVVGILQYMGTEESLKAFVVWTMGSLSNVDTAELYIFVPVVIAGLALSLMAVKLLNMLLLGEGNARTLGLNVRLSRAVIFVATTLLAGTVTAYCGPIGFVGLAMPHLARMTFRTSDHRVLMPAAMLWGGVSMLLCCLLSDVIARYSVMLPVNTLTALLGVPIIIFVVLRNRNRQ